MKQSQKQTPNQKLEIQKFPQLQLLNLKEQSSVVGGLHNWLPAEYGEDYAQGHHTCGFSGEPPCPCP